MRTRQSLHPDPARDSTSTDHDDPDASTASRGRPSSVRADRIGAAVRTDDSPDRLAPTDAPQPPPTRAAPGAPLTFDPFCTRRCRNLVDGANASTPDPGVVTVVRPDATRYRVATDD